MSSEIMCWILSGEISMFEEKLKRSLDSPQAYRLLGLAVFLIIWEIAGMSGFSHGMIPTFSATLLSMITLIQNGTLIHHGLATLERVYAGFFLAALLGISSGVLIGWSWRAKSFFDVLIDFLRNVSSITLIPISILLIGIGFGQKLLILTYAAYFPIALNTISGVESAEKTLLEAARSMGASDWQVIKEVVIPSATPSIFTGLRLSMGVSFVVVIAAELVGSSSGLGYYLHEASRTYQIKQMFAAALFVTILGYLSNKAILYTQRKVVHWDNEQMNGVNT